MPRIRQLLHPVDPYRDLNDEASALDLQGWGSNHPIFAQIIAKIRPALIIEVGTWKGASAVHMARVAKSEGLNDFETGGIAGLFRGFQKSENAALDQKMPFMDGH